MTRWLGMAASLVLVAACGGGSGIHVTVSGKPAGDYTAHVGKAQKAGTYTCAVKSIDEEGDVLGTDTFTVKLPAKGSVTHRGKVVEVGSDLPDHFDGSCSPS